MLSDAKRLLRRHQLAYLTADGWRAALAGVQEAPFRGPLQRWAANGWPLVVTRQPPDVHEDEVALGWPAPPECGRARVGVTVPLKGLAWLNEFPLAARVLPLLACTQRAALEPLLQAVCEYGVQPRVYGSYGWQLLTGLPYVHAASDLDFWLPTDDLAQADAVCTVLLRQEKQLPRLDGELLFPDGAAVAWREYWRWRRGLTTGMLVKRLAGVSLDKTLLARSAGEVVVP